MTIIVYDVHGDKSQDPTLITRIPIASTNPFMIHYDNVLTIFLSEK